MSLIYYPDSQPGISRRSRGRGFSYLAADGTGIDCRSERARIDQLAIPPAYEDVWISPLTNGHLQATGRDARRRKQYRYHPSWSQQRAALKFDQLIQLSQGLPRLRRWIAERLRGEAGELETAIAAVLALIDRASMRVGHPDYTAENGSYGATTLRNRHVDFDGAQILLNYKAKGGRPVANRLNGDRLQHVLQRSQDLPGAEIVTWLDDRGDARIVRSEHLRDVLGEICGDAITPKTLRTWNGSHEAFLTAMTVGDLTVKKMCEAADARLHNTEAIARKSYVHPAIIALADLSKDERTRLIRKLKPKENAALRRGEAELTAFLRSDAVSGAAG